MLCGKREVITGVFVGALGRERVIIVGGCDKQRGGRVKGEGATCKYAECFITCNICCSSRIVMSVLQINTCNWFRKGKI